MRKTHVLSCCLLLQICLAPVCMGEDYITSQQAMQAVGSFEGSSTINFQYVKMEQEPDARAWEHPHYCLDQENSTRSVSWCVDAVTGEVTFAIYHDAFPSEEASDPIGPLTQDQCRAVAQAFAEAKYQGFQSTGFVLRDQRWDGSGWAFTWRQVLTNNATTPNSVMVSINPVDGVLECYSAVRVAMQPAAEIQVSAASATVIAEEACGIVTEQTVDGPILIADPEHTYWLLRMAGLDAGGQSVEGEAQICAITGVVLTLDTESAGSAQRPWHADSRSVLVRARQLFTRGGYSVWWDKRTRVLHAVRQTVRVEVAADVSTIHVDGRPLPISRPPHIVGGRMLVPPDIAAHIP